MLYVAAETASEIQLSPAFSSFIVANKRVFVMRETTDTGGACASEQKYCVQSRAHTAL